MKVQGKIMSYIEMSSDNNIPVHMKGKSYVFCNMCMKEYEVEKKSLREINKEFTKKGWICKRDQHFCPFCTP